MPTWARERISGLALARLRAPADGIRTSARTHLGITTAFPIIKLVSRIYWSLRCHSKLTSRSSNWMHACLATWPTILMAVSAPKKRHRATHHTFHLIMRPFLVSLLNGMMSKRTKLDLPSATVAVLVLSVALLRESMDGKSGLTGN